MVFDQRRHVVQKGIVCGTDQGHSPEQAICTQTARLCVKTHKLLQVCKQVVTITSLKQFVNTPSRRGWLTLSATSREIDCKPRIPYFSKKNAFISKFYVDTISICCILRLMRYNSHKCTSEYIKVCLAILRPIF